MLNNVIAIEFDKSHGWTASSAIAHFLQPNSYFYKKMQETPEAISFRQSSKKKTKRRKQFEKVYNFGVKYVFYI